MSEKLINRLKTIFEKSGFKVKKAYSNDKSSSWLNVRHKTKKSYCFELSFNYQGTELWGMDMFKHEYRNVTEIIKELKPKGEDFRP